MIQLKKDLIIKSHDGSFMTYPKDLFSIKPRISVVTDEEVNIELRVVNKDGDHRSSVGNLHFRANDSKNPYSEAIEKLDSGRLTAAGVKWIREQTFNNIDLKQFI